MMRVLICLLSIWAGVTVILFARFICRYRKVVKEFNAYGQREDEQCKRILCRISEKGPKHIKIALKFSDKTAGPMGYGLFAGTIILPERAYGGGELYGNNELYYILLHEYTHFLNNDIWKKIIFQILKCIFWWNPLVFIIENDYYRALEIKCDLDVTREMEYDEKAEYLNTILTVLKKTNLKKQDDGQYEAAGLLRIDREFEIKERFQMVLNECQNGKNIHFPGILLLLFKRRVGRMNNVMRKSMKTSVTLKTLCRSPLKTALSFLLIAAASFALFSKLTDYAITSRQTREAKGFYHCVAGLDNEVARYYLSLADVTAGNGGISYGVEVDAPELPWPDDDKLSEFASLPGVTLADTRYRTSGMVENYKRLVDCDSPYRSIPVVFEGTFAGYEDDTEENVTKNHVNLKFDDVRVIVCEKELSLDTSLNLMNTPLGDNYFAKSPYTMEFFDDIRVGSRCLVLGNYDGSTADNPVKFWYNAEEGALRVIDGLSENYLDTDM